MLNLVLNVCVIGLFMLSILSFSSCDKPYNPKASQKVESRGINKDNYTDSLYNKGKILYKSNCIRCHSLNGRGGNIGPALDELSKSMDGTFIREAILEPNRLIKKGYRANVMPQDFANKLSESEMDSLVFYLTN